MPETDYRLVATRFASACQRYCDIVDASNRTEKIELLVQLYRALPELILEAIQLPDTDPWKRDEEEGSDLDLTPSARPSVRMTNQEWGDLYKLPKEKLGEPPFYWTVFNPVEDKEAIEASLADDIADVYRDVIEGVQLLGKTAASPGEIIWEWRISFHSHWGDHAIQALRTIHWLLSDKLPGLG